MIRAQLLATRRKVWASASWTGSLISAMISGRFLEITHQATPPTSRDLTMVLTSSASVSVENMRPMPAIGFNLENFGASDLAESSQPPSSMGATSAATSIAASSGTSACNA